MGHQPRRSVPLVRCHPRRALLQGTSSGTRHPRPHSDASTADYDDFTRECRACLHRPAVDSYDDTAFYGYLSADGEYGSGATAAASAYGTFFDNGTAAASAYDVLFVNGTSGDVAHSVDGLADGFYAAAAVYATALGYAAVTCGDIGSPTASTDPRARRHLRGPARLGDRLRARDVLRPGHHSAPISEGTTGVCNYEDNYGLAASDYDGPPH